MMIPRVPMRFFTTHCTCCEQGNPIGVHVMGGNTDGGTGRRDVNWAYSTADTWLVKATLSSARRRLMGSQISALGYVFGGITTGNIATAEEYTPGSDSWAALTSMTTAGSYGTSNSDGTDAFVVRGIDFTSLANHDQYDVSGDSWSAKATLFQGANQNYLAMAGFGFSGLCHALGGWYSAGTAVLNANKQYSVSGDSWTAKTSFTTARGHHFGESDGSTYGWIWSGQVSSGGAGIDDLRRYDLAGDSWTNLTAPTPGLHEGGGAYQADILYTMGGGDRDTPTTINAYQYDIAGGSWSALTDLPDLLDESLGMGGLI